MFTISERIWFGIAAIGTGLSLGEGRIAINGIKELLPIVLIPFLILAAIAIIALVFGILNYRTNKKILKKLEEQKDGG